jgi:hypothetical protein
MEVKDDGPGFEPYRHRLGAEDTGWGLHILDQLVDRWGTTADTGGVWVEMDVRANRTSHGYGSNAEDPVES